MLIIKSNIKLSDEKLKDLHSSIVEMQKDGVIVLPFYCNVLYISEQSDTNGNRLAYINHI